MFLTSVQDFFVFNSQSKNSNQFKNPMSREPFVSRAKVLPAKRNEKGYGDENDPNPRPKPRGQQKLKELASDHSPYDSVL